MSVLKENDVVIACNRITDFGTHEFRMDGMVEPCVECNKDVWVSDDSREFVPDGKPLCLDCLVSKMPAGEDVALTPFGEAIAKRVGVDPNAILRRVLEERSG